MRNEAQRINIQLRTKIENEKEFRITVDTQYDEKHAVYQELEKQLREAQREGKKLERYIDIEKQKFIDRKRQQGHEVDDKVKQLDKTSEQLIKF